MLLAPLCGRQVCTILLCTLLAHGGKPLAPLASARSRERRRRQAAAAVADNALRLVARWLRYQRVGPVLLLPRRGRLIRRSYGALGGGNNGP